MNPEHRRAEKCFQSWESPSSDCSRRKAARLLKDLPSTKLRFNSFFNVIAGTVMVIRCGERKIVPLSEPLLIPDEAFICRSPCPEEHFYNTAENPGCLSISTYSSNCSGSNFSAPWARMTAADSEKDLPVLALIAWIWSTTLSGMKISIPFGNLEGSNLNLSISLAWSDIRSNPSSFHPFAGENLIHQWWAFQGGGDSAMLLLETLLNSAVLVEFQCIDSQAPCSHWRVRPWIQ